MLTLSRHIAIYRIVICIVITSSTAECSDLIRVKPRHNFVPSARQPCSTSGEELVQQQGAEPGDPGGADGPGCAV